MPSIPRQKPTTALAIDHPTVRAAPPDALLPEADVAALLGIAVATLRGWRLRGQGPQFIRLGSRAVRYRRGDVSAFIADGRRRSTSDRGEALIIVPSLLDLLTD